MQEERVYTHRQLLRALGVGIILLSMIFLISPFSTHMWGITFLFVYLFGLAYYWFFQPLLMALGFYLVFRRNEEKSVFTWRFYLGVTLCLLGIGITFGFITAATYQKDNLSLYDLHGATGENGYGLIASFATFKGVFDLKNGGGILFSAIADGINHASAALTLTICIVLMVAGVIFLFYPLLRKLFRYVSAHATLSRAKKANDAALRYQKEQEEKELQSYMAQNQPISSQQSLPYEATPLHIQETVQAATLDEASAPLPSRSATYHAHAESPIPEEVPPASPTMVAPMMSQGASELQEATFAADTTPVQKQPEVTMPTPAQTSSFEETPKAKKPAPLLGEVVVPEEPVTPASTEQSMTYPQDSPVILSAPKGDDLQEASLNDSPVLLTPEKPAPTESVKPTPTPKAAPVVEKPIQEEKIPVAEPVIETAKEEPIPEPVHPEPAIAPEEPLIKRTDPKPIPVAQPAVEKPANEAEPAEEPVKEQTPEEKIGIAPAKPRPRYHFPPVDLLRTYERDPAVIEQNKADCQKKADIINQCFTDLNAHASVVGFTIGPSITRFDVQPDRTVKVDTVGQYVQTISARLGGIATRFQQTVPGKTTSGLEIPNERTTVVSLKEMIEALPPTHGKPSLMIPFGVNVDGKAIYGDLADFPHMLVGGGTGSGKSIFAHGILASLIMRNRPEDLKLVLIDPKHVEMTKYDDIPHLLCPVINGDMNEAKVCLEKLIDEMEARFMRFAFAKVRDIGAYNSTYCPEAHADPMPYIVVFVDEFADLVDTCKDIFKPVGRLAQKARAAGIHLIIATQRPSVDVINGNIKNNLPVRVSLSVSRPQDSITILGEGGAENLRGHGDMLVICPSINRSGTPIRCQGCMVQDEELQAITDYVKEQQKVSYDPRFLDLKDHSQDKEIEAEEIRAQKAQAKEDANLDFYEQVKRDVMQRDYTSISRIQREYSIGFPRAGKIMNRLVQEGIVAPPDSQSSAKGSKVLVHAAPESDGSDRLSGDND